MWRGPNERHRRIGMRDLTARMRDLGGLLLGHRGHTRGPVAETEVKGDASQGFSAVPTVTGSWAQPGRIVGHDCHPLPEPLARMREKRQKREFFFKESSLT